jgi:hypothetical protein
MSVLFVVVGLVNQPDQEAATAVVEFLMMGVRTPKTCCAVNKRLVIN